MSDDQPNHPTTVTRRIMIMLSIILGSTLYSTTLLIASTLLPQMQGAMSATQDEIAWAMTFNILATAVVTPMTGWLVARFGRRGVMVGSMALFSLLRICAAPPNSLETLVLWRIIQGGAGAPVTPLSQTILFDVFPRRQQRMITSIYGMTVVIGPVIGPALGGYMSDMYSWRWAFYGLVPVGIASCIGLQLSMPPDPPRNRVRLDWIGFLSLSAAISCVQLVLSRGQRLDWFESPEIWSRRAAAVLAFYIFVAHSVTAQRPFLNMRLLLDRNYALGLVLVGVFGMLNVTPMVLLPPLLQQHAGFPDSLIGEVLAARGVGATIGFFRRDVHGPARPAHRHGARVRAAGGLRPVADEHRPQCRHGHAGGQQHAAGHGDRHHLGAADDRQLCDAWTTVTGRKRWRCSTCCATSGRAFSSRCASPTSCG